MSQANYPLPALNDYYRYVWQKLKLHRELAIACPRAKQKTLIKGIINVKHREFQYLKAADLPSAGKLEITKDEHTLVLKLVPDLANITVGEL